MKEWLTETHGPGFELLRHFLRRFFDSDLITTPDHMIGVLIVAVPVFFQWFFLLMGPLRRKYAYLSYLQAPGPYRSAVRADELWLITLMMSAIGVLTAIKWQSLFPNLRDYQALGSLPLFGDAQFSAQRLFSGSLGRPLVYPFIPRRAHRRLFGRFACRMLFHFLCADRDSGRPAESSPASRIRTGDR